MSEFSEEWSRAVSHRYLPFYEKMLLTLRAQGYQRVVAVFGHKEEAAFVEKRLRQAGALGQLKIEYLARRGEEEEGVGRVGAAKKKRGVAAAAFPLGGSSSKKRIDIGPKPEMVLFFNPQNVGGDLAELTEFQRLTAVATLRGAPVVLVNPALTAFSHLPQGMMDDDYVRPMILSDFKPCFQASAHKYKYNPFLSYSIVRRGGEEAHHVPPRQPAPPVEQVRLRHREIIGAANALLAHEVSQVQMLQGMADSEERIARSRERERQYEMLVRTGKVADYLP